MYLGPRERIEGAKRLVHEQNGRVGRERTSDADPLPLASGEFVRMPGGELRWFEANDTERFGDAFLRFIFGPALQSGDQADVSLHREVRKEARFLDDVTHLAAQADGIPFRRGTAFDDDCATVWFEQAVCKFQSGGFSGAATAEQNERFTSTNFERQVLENGMIAALETDVAKFNDRPSIGTIHAAIVA